MKKYLENNLALKIIAVIFAMGLWLFVNNVDDPVITARYSVKVAVKNENYIYDDGKTYQIEEDARTVTVLIKGRESIVQNRTDLEVVADLTEIQDKESTSTYVPVTFQEVSGITLEDVEIFPKVIPIRIEDSDQKEFVVDVRTENDVDDDYEIGEKTSDPEIVTIQGPKSIIEKINTVVARVQLNGETSDTVIPTKLEIIDKNKEALTDDLEYLNFDIGNDRIVNVSLKLWKKRDGVKLEASYSGEPAQGYVVSRVTVTPQTISVAGSDEALQELEERGNTIEIPSELINVQGLTKDYQTRIELSSLLLKEDELMQASDENQTIQVQVSILPEDSKEYEVPTSSVQINNLESGLHVVFIRDSLTVRIKGADGASLDDLSVEDIQLSVDLKGLKADSYTQPVKVTLPAGYQLVDSVTADIQLTNIENTGE